MPKSSHRGAAVAVVVIAIIVAAAALNHGLNLAPSYEGPHVTFYGFQPAGTATVYTFNDPNPVNGQNNAPWVDSISMPATFGSANSYSWSGSGTTLDVKHTAPGVLPFTTVKVGVTASTSIQPDYNPATGTPIIQNIDYFVPDPYNANNSVEVQGYMVQYKVQVVLNVDSEGVPRSFHLDRTHIERATGKGIHSYLNEHEVDRADDDVARMNVRSGPCTQYLLA
jgi:hypothetical protein